MIISYNSGTLQEICFISATAENRLGDAAAKSLQARHADLLAAKNVFDLPVGKIFFDGAQCTLALGDLLSINMVPNYPAVGEGADYDWATVGRVKIMGINGVE